jgi:hypothetical protein
MSILNPTPQEIDDDKMRTYREYWNPPKTAITNPAIESLHNDLNDLIKKEAESLKPEHFKQRTFIVAGNYTEYHDWLKRKGYSEIEYKYVMGAETLKGISAENLKGVFIGTWKNRSDIDEIRQQIAVIKSKLSDGTLVTGSNGTTVYYDGQNYPISRTFVSGGGGGFISSGGVGQAATYGSYDVTTEIVSTAVIIREELHDEIEKLGYGDATRDAILAAIDRVLDKY